MVGGSIFDANQTFDGYDGFVIDRQYQLSYTKEFDEVRLVIPHGSPGAVPLVLSVAEFEKWFRK